MKLFPTILAGVLSVTVAAIGCSDDEDPGGTGGSSGTGAGATGGTGGRGSGGSGGSGASGGSAGADAQAEAEGGQCSDSDPATIQECKTNAASEQVCEPLANCSCDKCACLLAECQADPGCLALRLCSLRTGCCSPALVAVGCVGMACEEACSTEVTNAGAGLITALNTDNCVYGDNDAGAACAPCPNEGGVGSDAGDAGDGG
jgi:hypothetical protein